LALAGYITAGNQLLREARSPDFAKILIEDSNLTRQTLAEIGRIAGIGWAIHLALVSLPFAGRSLRGWRDRPPCAANADPSERAITVYNAGSHGVGDFAGQWHPACVGVRWSRALHHLPGPGNQGIDRLPEPTALEAKALARIGAARGVRLACQICPTADISIMPLLAADASAADGTIPGGLEGSERLITIVFVDLRGSTTWARPSCPTTSSTSSTNSCTR